MTVEGSLELARERDRRGPEPAPGYRTRGGSAAFLGKVVTAAGPGKFLTANPVVVTGAETAGGSPSYAVDTGTVLGVYVAGAGTPTAGDYLVCRSVAHRWVTEGRKATTVGTVKVITWACDGTTAIAGVSVTISDGSTTVGPVSTATTAGIASATLTPTHTGSWTISGLFPDGTTMTAPVTVGSTNVTATLREYYCGVPGTTLPASVTLTTGGNSYSLSLTPGSPGLYSFCGVIPGVASVDHNIDALGVDTCVAASGQAVSFVLARGCNSTGCMTIAGLASTYVCPGNAGPPAVCSPLRQEYDARTNATTTCGLGNPGFTGVVTFMSTSPFFVSGNWLITSSSCSSSSGINPFGTGTFTVS